MRGPVGLGRQRLAVRAEGGARGVCIGTHRAAAGAGCPSWVPSISTPWRRTTAGPNPLSSYCTTSRPRSTDLIPPPLRTLILERLFYHSLVDTKSRLVTAMAEQLRLRGYAATGIKGCGSSGWGHHRLGVSRVPRREARARCPCVPGFGSGIHPVAAPAAPIHTRISSKGSEQRSRLLPRTSGRPGGQTCVLSRLWQARLRTSNPCSAISPTPSSRAGSRICRRTSLRRGLRSGDARLLAQAMLSALEGAFVLSRVTRSTEPPRGGRSGNCLPLSVFYTAKPLLNRGWPLTEACRTDPTLTRDWSGGSSPRFAIADHS